MSRRVLLVTALLLLTTAATAASATGPTLRFRLFTTTNLPLGQVLWTGSSFVYTAEDVGTIETSDARGRNLEPLASFKQGGEEMRCTGSIGKPYWPPGLYCHTPDNRILRIARDGTMKVLTRLPRSAGRVSDGSIAFDNVGAFGHRLLVASGGSKSKGGRIYAVGQAGRVSLVGSYPGPGGADNIIVAPRSFGRAGGQLLIAIDQRLVSGRVVAIDHRGAVTVLADDLGDGVNPIQIIRSAPRKRTSSSARPGFYFGDTHTRNVYFAPAAALRPYVGDVIVGAEMHAWFWILRPKAGGGFETLRVNTNLPSRKWSLEGAAYVP